MSVNLACDKTHLVKCLERNRRNLEIAGINLSTKNTIMFAEGLGEYTSWYMDTDFISQFGVETAALRPQGKNPYDDLYFGAKSTTVALQTLYINDIGASARLRLGADGCRRL